MNGQLQPGLIARIRPYLLITLTGILAFAPVSFMLRSLKNDIVAIEYPINYFISQCIHYGELPYWFNTWGMGFPLHSSLTWGIYSTPQMIFCSLFDYNLYVLHIEFMFFLLMAGWGMYHLLQKYVVKDSNIALLLAVCYMLSGFMVGSTQWLLYITAASFMPFIICSLLKLLYAPSVRNAFLLAVLYTMMFTSVYAAFNIITTYCLFFFIIVYLVRVKSDNRTKASTLSYIVLAGLFTSLLCGPCIYYTAELLHHIDRGSSIEANTAFFNSNYLHPAALSNMLLPFSSVRMNFHNTEGTMLNTYAGLFVLLLIPGAAWQTIKEKNKSAIFLLAAAVIFLLLSFGGVTPIRGLFNFLPGFSYFRNPAIFRLFFLAALILYLAIILRNISFETLFSVTRNPFAKNIYITAWVLLAICVIILASNGKAWDLIYTGSWQTSIKNMSLSGTLLISSFIQAMLLIAILFAAKMRSKKPVTLLLLMDLTINTLICTPFFSVSNYPISEVNNILQSKDGFPIQVDKVNKNPATYTDKKMNRWFNVNVFNKKVSAEDSYRGPLTLKDFHRFAADSNNLIFYDRQLVSLENNTGGAIQLLLQRPAHINVSVKLPNPSPITLLQNDYPGWKVYYNGNEMEKVKTNKTGITINAPAGEGVIDYKYERNFAGVSALLLHMVIICFLVWQGVIYTRRKIFIPSSPS
ncbi:MAG: hypothetical protein JNN00_13600 [Chitinophagaceae bacterium]|nr:hypothetical protein [Chitinophagaceae bacterium]